jgi:acyl-CoA synthetase (AMP-forming)/AMP-acid ligase II
VTGLCGVLLPFLHAGGAIVMMAEFKRRRFLERAQAERMTHALLVPAMYGLCLLEPDLAAFDLSSWRIGAYGGAPMPVPTAERFARAFPGLQLRDCYGATETASPATITPLGVGADRAGSVGRPVPCGELIIMDDDGREAAPGAQGEIWIAGPMVVPGYWRAPEADAQAFAGGYWKSGDIGSIDADGYVRIADRKKDMINRAGFKVYPAEVESTLAGLHGVVEAAVVGRADDILGETVAAFLCIADGGPSAAQVRAWCAERMADYKVPQHIIIGSTPLPRNANGKIQKAELRAALAVTAAAAEGRA